MNDNSSYVLGLIALIMVSVSCVFFVFYRAGGGRESRSKTVRYAGCLGKLLFAASVILLSVSVLNGFAKGEGFRENLTSNELSSGFSASQWLRGYCAANPQSRNCPGGGIYENLVTSDEDLAKNWNSIVENGISAARRFTETVICDMIHLAADKYYNTSAPIVSDYIFDTLKEYGQRAYPQNQCFYETGDKANDPSSSTLNAGLFKRYSLKPQPCVRLVGVEEYECNCSCGPGECGSDAPADCLCMK